MQICWPTPVGWPPVTGCRQPCHSSRNESPISPSSVGPKEQSTSRTFQRASHRARSCGRQWMRIQRSRLLAAPLGRGNRELPWGAKTVRHPTACERLAVPELRGSEEAPDGRTMGSRFATLARCRAAARRCKRLVLYANTLDGTQLVAHSQPFERLKRASLTR